MWNKTNGKITTKEDYSTIVFIEVLYGKEWWNEKLRKWHLPQKLKCFYWLLLENKILTWKNLRKKGWHGTGFCPLCRKGEDAVEHLFMNCDFSIVVWSYVVGDMIFFVNQGEMGLEENFRE